MNNETVNSVLIDFKKFLNNTDGQIPTLTGERRVGRRKSITIHLNELFDGDEGRRAFLNWGFGFKSSNDLTDRELHNLWRWLSPRRNDDTGEWTIRAECVRTANLVMRALQVEAGQQELLP
jgi:hypothetical protein